MEYMSRCSVIQKQVLTLHLSPLERICMTSLKIRHTVLLQNEEDFKKPKFLLCTINFPEYFENSL